jgi:hypothetical protein
MLVFTCIKINLYEQDPAWPEKTSRPGTGARTHTKTTRHHFLKKSGQKVFVLGSEKMNSDPHSTTLLKRLQLKKFGMLGVGPVPAARFL